MKRNGRFFHELIHVSVKKLISFAIGMAYGCQENCLMDRINVVRHLNVKIKSYVGEVSISLS